MSTSAQRLGRAMPRHQLNAIIEALRGRRKVARVVTPGGAAPRGYPPSRKCEGPRFQSLVEDDCVRVLEIASIVTATATHPFVLDIDGMDGPTSYTPDVLVWMQDEGALFEFKPAGKLASHKVARRLREVARGLASHGIELVLMLDEDVRANGLQRELKELQRLRPARGRFRGDLDPNAWDPLYRQAVDEELLERWRRAQRTCDELLTRVMRRDPEDLLPIPNN